MGPRLFSRGNAWGWGSGAGDNWELLRGRDSSVAEISALFTLARGGPGFDGAATLQSRKSAGQKIVIQILRRASMGPRLFSRGNADRRQAGIALTCGSTGPRLFSRGNHTRLVKAPGCGRGFNGACDSSVAEMAAAFRAAIQSVLLQWGRESSVAEITEEGWTARCGVKNSWGRDSSVAEMIPWRPPRSPSRPLQWGRDSSVAEIFGTGLASSKAACFNGAATLQSRKCRKAARDPRCHRGGFNGAATLQSRK